MKKTTKNKASIKGHMEKRKRDRYTAPPPPPKGIIGQVMSGMGRLISGVFRFIGGRIRQSWQLTWALMGWCWRLCAGIIISLWHFITGGPDEPEYDKYGNPNVRAIRRRIARRYRRRNLFYIHIALYLFSIGGALLTQSSYGYRYSGGVFLFTLVWSVFLLLHYMHYHTANAVDNEVEAEIRRVSHPLPPLSEPEMRLSDDGELLYLVEDEEKQKRSY